MSQNFKLKVCNLRYTKNKMIVVCLPYGEFKYFSANTYGGIGNAKKKAREWILSYF